MKKHIVLLTKSYLDIDFKCWYEYHKKMGFIIHVFDNESSIEIEKHLKEGDTYHFIKGFPDQYKLYDRLLNGNNIYKLFEEGDIITFIDDDEYIWFRGDFNRKRNLKLGLKTNEFSNEDDKMEETLEEYLEKVFNKNDISCILMPQILMSSERTLFEREENYVKKLHNRRNDKVTQGKVFIKYSSKNWYNFNHNKNELGHVPFINGERRSVVNDSGFSETTYAEVDYNAHLRLYHYHIKSLEDWNKKYSRGSAALPEQWYEKSLIKNPYFDLYYFDDYTMKNTFYYFGI